MTRGSQDDPVGVPPAATLTRVPADSVATDTPVVLVTGLSGAGRSRALKCLEDLGFEAVDNLPLALFGMLVRGRSASDRRVAIGIDSRTRDFSADLLLDTAASLTMERNRQPFLLFLDCDDDVLIRRFTETRRRHPLAADRPVSDGIQLERQLLAPLRDAANLVLDTSMLAPADLQRMLQRTFSAAAEPRLTVTVQSFSFRRGLPREADLVFDVRFLDNPYYVPELRPLDGRDVRVAAHVAADPDFPDFFANLTRMLTPLLPRYRAEGKSYLTLAIGCTGGQHRSVFVAEQLGSFLAGLGVGVTVIHRDVGRSERDVVVSEPVRPATDGIG